MDRVVFSAFVALALAGCSMGTTTISSGFAGPAPTASVSPRVESAPALGSEPSLTASRKSSRKSTKKRGTRVASLGKDAAPAGTFSKAAHGALSKRNYLSTRLDVEKARALINDYRRSQGLKPLQVNAQLASAAKQHSRDLARWDRISHYGSDGSNPWDRVKRTGYNAKLAAENVGTGQSSIQEVFKGWQKSPGHNKNLLIPDAEHMGIALVNDPKTEFKTFWTLVIGSPL